MVAHTYIKFMYDCPSFVVQIVECTREGKAGSKAHGLGDRHRKSIHKVSPLSPRLANIYRKQQLISRHVWCPLKSTGMDLSADTRRYADKFRPMAQRLRANAAGNMQQLTQLTVTHRVIIFKQTMLRGIV